MHPGDTQRAGQQPELSPLTVINSTLQLPHRTLPDRNHYRGTRHQSAAHCESHTWDIYYAHFGDADSDTTMCGVDLFNDVCVLQSIAFSCPPRPLNKRPTHRQVTDTRYIDIL
jgi:hypothetical protein